jgi:methylamine dehydrogenase heavy chain
MKHMNVARRLNWAALYGLMILTAAQSAPVLAEGTSPLPAETSDVATLTPAGAHRVFVMADFDSPSVSVIDSDSDSLKLIGTVPLNLCGLMALSRSAERIFTVETFYSHGNRGTREDVLGVYDGRTLNLLKEVVLPGRLLAVPKSALFDVSEDGRVAYVYDMLPSSAVHVVDLEAGRVLTSIDLPGCALAFPYGPRSFASICGDGTIGVVQVPQTGDAQVAFSKPFFQPYADPLFEAGVVDRVSGQGWMLSYSGKVFPVRLGTTAVVGKAWSVTAAAGLPPAGTGVQELAWRPGGLGRMFALHRSSSTLYVLMHAGNHWTAKDAGTEVWVLDAANQKLIRRVKLEAPAQSIAVSQDDAPLLYVIGKEHEFSVLDGKTGVVLRKRKLSGVLAWVPGN